MNDQPEQDDQAVSAGARRIRAWRERLRARQDTELEQSLVRIGLAVAVFVYLLHSIGFSREYGGVFYVSLAYLLFSISVTLLAVISPLPSAARRLAATTGDIVAVSYANIVAGEICAPFYGGYLWLSIANGFRYGRRFLYITTFAACLGFSLVLLFSPFWIAHRVLGLGLLLWLAVLPMYVAVLLKRLEESLARAQEADRAKSRFLANMSHELRTPLNAIIGYSQLLKEEVRENGGAAQFADLGKIEMAGQHLLGLINGVLDLSKIDAGKMDVVLEEVVLKQELDRTIETLGPAARANGNRLVLNLDPTLDTLRTDPVRLRQILLNLLSNACKFTNNGTISLHVRPERRDGQSEMVFLVEDEGIGLDAPQLEGLFRPFYQGDASTTRRYGGTGLGLALSKRLCELLGGSISVASTSGKGSIFMVRLPMQNGDRLMIDTSLQWGV